MRIVLLRHGKPNLIHSEKITSAELGKWINQYNSASLDLECQPKTEAVNIIKSANKFVCSNLSRSTESANILGVNNIYFIGSCFREVELPYFKIPLLKLSPKAWSIIFRILWFCGLKTNSESLTEAKIRASTSVSKLKEIAKNNDSVVFIGHGFINKFIAKELLLSGWHNPVPLGNKYWEFGVYEYPTKN